MVMKEDLLRAKEILMQGEYTCVLCKAEQIYSSTERGIKPFLQWIEAGTNLKGFSAADKVIGKAAAFLYILLQIETVYAKVISEGALQVFHAHGISVEYDICVPRIQNRTQTGLCPMESAVWEITSAQQAHALLVQKVKEMQNTSGETTR